MSTNAQRLADAVLARRRELDVTQLEVWQAGGPSNTTLTAIEKGAQASLPRSTARKLDKGLQWEDGSARRVWDGTGEPIPLTPGLGSKSSARLRKIIEETADLDEGQRQRLLGVLDEEVRGA